MAFDDEHRRVLYVEGRVVGWTGTRAQYDWHIMSAPTLNREQIIFLEAEPLTEYEPWPHRGDAVNALRRHAERWHLEIVDRADAQQQFEARYSEALEQEIRELQARCRHVRLARRPEELLDRLHAYEMAWAQLREILEEHFTSHQDAWTKIQSLLSCCETDAPNSE
jgi:hypothetical protein